MNRILLVSLAAAGLIVPLSIAAPAYATNGGGHAGRTPAASGYFTASGTRVIPIA